MLSIHRIKLLKLAFPTFLQTCKYVSLRGALTWRRAATFSRFASAVATAVFAGESTGTAPTSSESDPSPPLISRSPAGGRRKCKAWIYCTPCRCVTGLVKATIETVRGLIVYFFLFSLFPFFLMTFSFVMSFSAQGFFSKQHMYPDS
jgi:hypothetical protein